MELKVRYDLGGDAAYIYLRAIEPGGAVHQEIVGGAGKGNVILDFDREGRLIGIEVLDASTLLPAAVISGATRID
jgi:uncharacterized protein YuzE